MRMQHRHAVRTAVAAALAAAVLSCTSPGEPAKASLLTVSAAAVTLDAIGATATITATVRDQREKAMNVSGVSWTTSASDVATVSATGLITATGNGTATITASYEGLSATLTTTVAQVPVAPVIVSGNLQQATVATQLAAPLVVRIEDRLGAPMAGRSVTFSILSGAGALSDTTVVSSALGLASTMWTLGTGLSPSHRVTAAVQGTAATTTFTAVAVAGPPAQLRMTPGTSTDGQVGNVSAALPVAPSVQLVDAYGNGVADATLAATVLSGGGAYNAGAPVTNASGIATLPGWVLGPTPGTNTLQAAHGVLTPVIFTAEGVLDRCGASGAQAIALGDTVTGSLSSTDCLLQPDGVHFDLYRVLLQARSSLLIEMSSTAIDTWLSLYDSTGQTLLAENDDIVRTVITDSRIGITLDPGAYLIRARSWGAGEQGTYRLHLRTARLGVPARIVQTAPNGQVAAPGATVATPPSVRVEDEIGQPVAGVTVTFATVGGIGSATGTVAVTDAAGVAAVGSWTLAAGANVLTASIGAGGSVVGDPAIYSAKGKASSAGFDISVRFSSVPTAAQLQAFSNAAARWETVITGDLPAQPLATPIEPGDCGNHVRIQESVDDLIITVSFPEIDGPGQILGSAGPCILRAAPSLIPVLGLMEFDAADSQGGGFGDVVLHEMGHVLGIGTIWTAKGFLELPSPTSGTGNDTYFDGPFAIAAFNTIGGQNYTMNKVPVENAAGGGGTRNSHWRESVFANELMTGIYNGGVTPMSIVTVQSLRDLGYAVDNAAADAFTVTATSGLRAEGEVGDRPIVLDDVRRGPIVLVDRSGRPVGGQPLSSRRVKPRPR